VQSVKIFRVWAEDHIEFLANVLLCRYVEYMIHAQSVLLQQGRRLALMVDNAKDLS
jgi:hypothetical protein